MHVLYVCIKIGIHKCASASMTRLKGAQACQASRGDLTLWKEFSISQEISQSAGIPTQKAETPVPPGAPI
jgi:hypothetical protein